MKRDSKIFVAGGTGLVGSAIIKNLLGKGYSNIVTNFHRRPLGSTRYAPHATGSSLRAEKLDLLDPLAVERFFAEEKPEFVFLAAAKVGGIVANNTYRAEFIYENLQIQNNVIHNAYKYGVKKLLFLGSTCIYPRECPQPMKEEYLLTGELEYTNEPYAVAKIAGIRMCESYNLQYGTNFISVMPTNLYGPHDNFDLEKSHVLPALIRKIHLGKALVNNDWKSIRKDLNRLPIEGITGEESEKGILDILQKYGLQFDIRDSAPNIDPDSVRIEIWGSGRPMREFLWSEDMADACVFLMEKIDFTDIVEEQSKIQHSPCSIDALSHEVRNTHLNIGTGEDISIRDLAYLIREVVGFRGEFLFNTSKPDGTMKKLTDPSRLHALGWRHRVELREGVERLYRWYLGV